MTAHFGGISLGSETPSVLRRDSYDANLECWHATPDDPSLMTSTERELEQAVGGDRSPANGDQKGRGER